MEKKVTITKLIEQFRGWFVFYFGAILLIKEIGAYDFIPSQLNSLLVLPAGLIGLLFIGYDLLQIIRKKKSFQYDYLLIIFMIILGISTALNYQHGLGANLKLILNELLYFFVIYEFGKNSVFSDKITEYFMRFLLGMWFLLVTISLGMFFVQFKYSVVLENRFHPMRLGFIENRLFGVFSDPNFASTIALFSILMSIFYLIIKKITRNFKVFLYTNIIFQISFILLSGSRTGLIELLIVFFIGVFLYVYHSDIFKAQTFVKLLLLSFISSLLLTGALYIALLFLKKGLAIITGVLVSGGKTDQTVSLTRDDVEGASDLSNGRFTIWKNGIDLYNQSRILGVGPSREGIVSSAKIYTPNGVIARTGLSLHSFIVQVLTGTGLIGWVTFFSFYISKMLKLTTSILTNKKMMFVPQGYYVLCIIAVSINAIFSSEIVLVNKIGAFIFWLLLGNVIGYINKEKQVN